MREASGEELAQILAQIASGGLTSRSGSLPAPEELDGALIRDDGRAVFPIIHGIPNLIADDALTTA